MSEDQQEEDVVKPEPNDEAVPPPKKRARTPSYELHIYSVEELSRFKKKELLADVSLLDGAFFLQSSICRRITNESYFRTNQEFKSELSCA